MFKNLKVLVYPCLFISSLSVPLNALSATPKDEQQDEEIKNTDRIIVTAQKREQSIHEVPISITALNDTQLEQALVNDLGGLQALAPSLSLGQFNLGQPQIYIRGIGSNEDGAGGDPSVGVFVDGVYIARPSATMFKFLDVARVEVLRGPQGTLYGKNIIGGAINIITHQAEDRQARVARIEIGSDGHRRIDGIYSNSLSEEENWHIKAVIQTQHKDGYIQSTNGFDLNDANDEGFRGQVVYQSNSNWTWRIGFDWTSQNQSGAGRHPQGGSLGSDVLPAIDPDFAADPFRSYADVEGYQKKRLAGWQQKVDWKFNNSSLTWLSAIRQHDFKFLNDDLAISPDEYFLDIVNYGEESSRQRSHELNWKVERENQDWIFGAYYLGETVSRQESFAANIIPTGTSLQSSNLDSYALFAHVIFKLNETENLTLGARQTWEQKSIHQTGIGGFVVSESYDVSDEQSWNHFSPKIAWDKKLSDSTMLFASFSRGYKSGGYQGQAPNAIAAQTPFDEEVADNLEFGFKITGDHYTDFIHTNIFFTDYKDLQILELFQQEGDPVGVLITQNAAEAEV